MLNRKNKIIEENIFLHANIQLIVIDTIENRKCDCNRKMSSFTAYEKNTSRSERTERFDKFIDEFTKRKVS